MIYEGYERTIEFGGATWAVRVDEYLQVWFVIDDAEGMILTMVLDGGALRITGRDFDCHRLRFLIIVESYRSIRRVFKLLEESGPA